MKINFTKAEYRLLLDLVSLGTWVLTSHDTEEDQKKKKYEEVEQKIFSHAKEFGCEKLIKYDEKFGAYFETREFDETEKYGFIEEYNENTFWDELINRLAERDFIKEHGFEEIEKMSFEERIRNNQKHEDKWTDEFEAHGIDRLKIDET
jgi:hypothetical protein